MIKNNWKFIVAFLVGFISVTTMITTFSDTKNKRSSFDGLVLSDKAGKSYMLEYKYAGTFNVVEFDTTLMRAKRP